MLLTARVFRFHAQVAVAASTLVAAALFKPAPKDALEMEAVRDDLAGVVDQALGPAHLRYGSAGLITGIDQLRWL